MNYELIAEKLKEKRKSFSRFGALPRDLGYELGHQDIFALEAELTVSTYGERASRSLIEEDEKLYSEIVDGMKEREILGYFTVERIPYDIAKEECDGLVRDGFKPKAIITKAIIRLDDTFYNQTDDQAVKTLCILHKILKRVPRDAYDRWHLKRYGVKPTGF